MSTRSGWPQRHHQRQLVVLAGAVAGAAFAAAPTGAPVADALWSAAFVAGLAHIGGYAPRQTMLILGGVTTALAGTGLSLALAVVAVVAAVVSATRTRTSLRWSTGTTALIGLSLLTGSGPDSHLLSFASTTIVSSTLLYLGYKGMSRRRRRRVSVIAAITAGSVAVCLLAGLGAVLLAREHADRGIDALQAAQVAGTGGDLEAAVSQFREAEDALRAAGRPLSTYGRLGRVVPVLSQQVDAASISVDAAGDAAEASRRAGSSIELSAIGLQGGAVDLVGLAATGGPLRLLVESLAATVSRLDGIDHDWLLAPITDAVDEARSEARRATATADRLERAVRVAPDLLGADGPRRYIVLFTTPVEARNRFGFPGAYAVVRFDGGRIDYEFGGPMADLVREQRSIDQSRLALPNRVLAYGNYGVTRDWRAATLPPDGPSVAQLVTQLSAQSPVGAVDGVVLADPAALAELVGLVGDVPLPQVGINLTRDSTVEFLTRRQYLEFPQLGQQQDRKDLLADVADVIGARLETLSLPQVRAVVNRFGPLVGGGHLVFAVPEARAPTAAALLADVGLDGAFPHPPGADVLYVGHRNNGGNKIDLFLRREISYAVRVDDGGALTAELTVELTNGAPGSGLPFYLIGSVAEPRPAPGTNRGTVLIYSRHLLRSITVDGTAVSAPVLTDGDLYVYQVQLDIGPGATATVVASFAGSAPSVPYRLVAFPGGLLTPDMAHISAVDDRAGTAIDRSQRLTGPVCLGFRGRELRCR